MPYVTDYVRIIDYGLYNLWLGLGLALGGSKILIDLRSINIFEEGYHMAADQSRWSDAFRIEIHFYTGAIDRLSMDMSDKATFVCQFCDKTFGKNFTLRRHVRLSHKDCELPTVPRGRRRKTLKVYIGHSNYQTCQNTIRYDSVYLTCSKKLTGSQLSLPHGTNKKLKCKTKNKMISVIGPAQSRYCEAVQ